MKPSKQDRAHLKYLREILEDYQKIGLPESIKVTNELIEAIEKKYRTK